jgi:hypothetical protein
METKSVYNDFSNFHQNSSLDPILRIIQKKQINIIDVDRINTYGNKKTNEIALEYFRDNIRKEYIDSFKDEIVIEKWFSPVEKLNDFLLNYALKTFKKYIDNQDEFNRFIYAINVDNDKVLIELDNRYCKSYQDKIIRRTKYLNWKYRKTRSVLLTLDPKQFNEDKFEMWKNIKSEFNRFLTNLKYYFKKQKRVFPPYICSIEAQKNGNPHLHICFLGASRILDWRKIRDIWKLGHIYINRDNSGRKIRNPVNYLMKYITKTYTDTDENNVLTQSLCWLFNIRSYQCSRGLIIPLKPKKDNFNWFSKYLIIVDDDIPIKFINSNIEKIIEFSDNHFLSSKYDSS